MSKIMSTILQLAGNAPEAVTFFIRGYKKKEI